jgi:hypothetical protein
MGRGPHKRARGPVPFGGCRAPLFRPHQGQSTSGAAPGQAELRPGPRDHSPEQVMNVTAFGDDLPAPMKRIWRFSVEEQFATSAALPVGGLVVAST